MADNFKLVAIAIKLALDPRLEKKGKFEVEAEVLEQLLNDEKYEAYITDVLLQ